MRCAYGEVKSDRSQCLPADQIRFLCRSPSTLQAIPVDRSTLAETTSAVLTASSNRLQVNHAARRLRLLWWRMWFRGNAGATRHNSRRGALYRHTSSDCRRRVVVPWRETDQSIVGPRPVVRTRRPLHHCLRAVPIAVWVRAWVRRVMCVCRAADRFDLVRAVVAARERRRHVQCVLMRGHLWVQVLAVKPRRPGDCAVARVCRTAAFWNRALT